MSPVTLGTGTYAGLAGAAATFTGAVVAATQGLTVESVTGAVLAGLILLRVMGGRYAQAVALIRQVATEVKPFVDRLADPRDLADEDEQYGAVPVGRLESREAHSGLGDGDDHGAGL